MEHRNVQAVIGEITIQGVRHLARRAGEKDRQALRAEAERLRNDHSGDPWVAARSHLSLEEFLQEVFRAGMEEVRRA